MYRKNFVSFYILNISVFNLSYFSPLFASKEHPAKFINSLEILWHCLFSFTSALFRIIFKCLLVLYSVFEYILEFHCKTLYSRSFQWQKREKFISQFFFLSFIHLLPLSIRWCQFFRSLWWFFFSSSKAKLNYFSIRISIPNFVMVNAINKKCESKKRNEHNICAIFQLNSSFQFIPKEEKKYMMKRTSHPVTVSTLTFYLFILSLHFSFFYSSFFIKYFCLSEWFLHPDL